MFPTLHVDCNTVIISIIDTNYEFIYAIQLTLLITLASQPYTGILTITVSSFEKCNLRIRYLVTRFVSVGCHFLLLFNFVLSPLLLCIQSSIFRMLLTVVLYILYVEYSFRYDLISRICDEVYKFVTDE